MVDTIRQFEFMPVSAPRTILRSVSRIDFDYSFTSICRFVSEQIQKHSPCRISNGFVNAMKVVFFHVIDGKVFNDNSIELAYKFASFLMNKVFTLPDDAFMHTCNHLTGLFAKLRILSLFRKFTLSFGKSFLFLAEKTRIFNLLASRKRGKTLKTHINANGRFNRFFSRFVINITGETYIPLTGRSAPNSAGLDRAFNVPMFVNSNFSYFRKMQGIVKPEAALWESKAIIAIKSPEPWIAWFFTSLDSTEESTKSKVNSHRNILKNLTENIFKKRVFFFKFRECFGLFIPRKAFLFRFPGYFVLFKKMVVKPAAAIKGLFKDCSLFACWENSVLESFSHNDYTLYADLYKCQEKNTKVICLKAKVFIIL